MPSRLQGKSHLSPIQNTASIFATPEKQITLHHTREMHLLDENKESKNTPSVEQVDLPYLHSNNKSDKHDRNLMANSTVFKNERYKNLPDVEVVNIVPKNYRNSIGYGKRNSLDVGRFDSPELIEIITPP